MKIIELNNTDLTHLNLYHSLINFHLESLLVKRQRNRKKITELQHVGKFLLFFGNKIKIEKLSEQPDFILKKNQDIIGLEHQIIIDSVAEEKEGFYKNIFFMQNVILN